MHHCHLSLVVKNMEWNIHQAGVLTCPGEKQLTLHRFWVLKNPTAPSTSEMSSAIYLCFLSGSAQFFLFTLLFFVSLLISYLWRAQTVGNFSAQLLTVWAGTYLTRWEQGLHLHQGEGHCLQHRHENDWQFSDTPLGSDWLCWSRSW